MTSLRERMVKRWGESLSKERKSREGHNEWEDLENHDCACPEGTRYIETEKPQEGFGHLTEIDPITSAQIDTNITFIYYLSTTCICYVHIKKKAGYIFWINEFDLV